MAANQREIDELQKSWKQKYDESQRAIKVLMCANFNLFTVYVLGKRRARKEKKESSKDYTSLMESA